MLVLRTAFQTLSFMRLLLTFCLVSYMAHANICLNFCVFFPPVYLYAVSKTTSNTCRDLNQGAPVFTDREGESAPRRVLPPQRSVGSWSPTFVSSFLFFHLFSSHDWSVPSCTGHRQTRDELWLRICIITRVCWAKYFW